MNELPEKPSALIRLALSDLEKASISPEYSIDMGRWHSRQSAYGEKLEFCRVCLAGSVMAMTLKVPHDAEIEIDSKPFEIDAGVPVFDNLKDIPIETQRKLYAINDFRTGNVFGAMEFLYPDMEKDDLDKLAELDRHITDYSSGPEIFCEEMRELANDLEARGY